MSGRSVASRLALSFGVLVGALLLLEGGSRVWLHFHPPPDKVTGIPDVAFGTFDPDLGWKLRPGVSTRVHAEAFDYTLTTNSRGFRGREHAYEHPPDVLRIVVLGDSVAWGWGVDDGLNFSDLIERDLGPKVEVVNLACPGYGTDQELWLLEREGRRYEPDIVLLAFVLNDVLGNEQTGDKPRLVRADDGTWKVENQPVADSRIRFGSASRRWREKLRATSALAEMLLGPGAKGAPPEEKKPKTAYTYETAWNEIADPQGRTHELLARLAAACREIGAKLVAFDAVHKHDRFLYDPTKGIPDDAPATGFETMVSKKLREAGDGIGFETLSIDQALLDVSRTGVVLHCGDGHFNARGHEIVAAELEKWIRAELLKPR